MLNNIEVLCHSSIRINKEKIIYIDPFKIDKKYNDADIIEDTFIVVPKGMSAKLLKQGFKQDYIVTVEPDNTYMVKDINFKTIPAYNINKQFHPKENNWVGYIIQINGVRYYIAGDTDVTEENKKVKCDVAFVPVGGTYTMDSKEAAKLVNEIKPKIVVPIHYGSVVGTNQDAIDFISLLDSEVEGIILMR